MPLSGLDREASQAPLADQADATTAGATTCTENVPARRVLHLVNGEHYSGAERVQDLLAGQLPRYGFRVGFACLKPGRFPTTRQTKDAPLVELPMRGRFDLRVVPTLAEFIQRDGYELVHAHTPRTALVGRLASRRAGVPLVYHVHSPAGHDSTRRLLNWTNSLVERYCLRDAERLIVVSPALGDYMIDRDFSAERITYVPNGVPPGADPADRPPPRDEWTLGTVALFRPRKGTEVLLEALALLRSRGGRVRLRAVGGFESQGYESSIRALATRLDLDDAIDWVGFTPNVGTEWARFDLFVLPSLFGEGLPMVVLEAMAAGVPIIASRAGGVPEAVRHRETGLLVDPGSVSQLAAAIEEFLAGNVHYTTLSQAARCRHAEHFSDAAMAKRVADVYRDVLASALAT